MTSTAGGKQDAQWSPDGKEVFYLEGGRINVINVESRRRKPLAVTAEMDVDFSREKEEVFRQAWSYLNDNFYDAKLRGRRLGRPAQAIRSAGGGRDRLPTKCAGSSV